MSQPVTARLVDQAYELLGRGDHVAAKAMFEQVCAHDTRNAEARMMIGAILAETGDLTGAESSLRQAFELDPEYPEVLNYLGKVLAAKGQASEAKGYLERAVELDPEYAEAWMLLGSVHGMLKSFDGAEVCSRRAIALQPESLEAGANLANALLLQGKRTESISAYRDAARLSTTNPGSYFRLGCALQELGEFDTAAGIFRKALQIKPDFVEAGIRLAIVLQTVSDHRGAMACCEAVLQRHPDVAETHHVLAVSLVALDRRDEASQHFNRAIELKPGYLEPYLGLATVMLTQGEPELAREVCDKALALDPANPDAIALAANIAKRLGETERAHQLLSPLMERGVTGVNVAVSYALISRDLGRQRDAIALMEKVLAMDTTLGDTARTNLHFNLGMLYDDISDYDSAFSHYERGNKLKRVSFDKAEYGQLIERIIGVHSAEFMARAPRSRAQSDRPVFIVGMVRSGTTLAEQILSSHPQVFGAGELPDMTETARALPGVLGMNLSYPECIAVEGVEHLDAFAQRYLDRLNRLAPAALRVTDKLPGNFMYLGLIEMLFPNARVIHCIRDPMDTCLSAYFQDFSSTHRYAYDLGNLGAFYRGYLNLMDHWRKVIRLPLLEVRYEDMVSDQERVSRAMVAFCGLEWDDRCLRYHEKRRFVGTASYDQVNRPMYTRSVSRWKHYERYLDPLRVALEG